MRGLPYKSSTTDHDAEIDAIPDALPAMRLTPDGERVAHQLLMLGEDQQDALMAALLEGLEG